MSECVSGAIRGRWVRRGFVAVLAIWAITASTVPTTATADESEAARLLPATTLVYAELTRPAEFLDQILDHSLRAKIEQLESVQGIYDRPEYKQFLIGLTALEGALGKPWRAALKEAAQDGLYIGVEAQTEGVVLMARGKDAESVQRVRDAIITLARANAQQRQADDPVKQAEYRGIQANEINEAKFAVVGRWLLLTQEGELGKQLIDRYLDGTPNPLADVPAFQQAVAARGDSTDIWGWVHLQPIRDSGEAEELFAGRADNPAAELLFGGLLNVFQKANYLTGSLSLDERGLQLAFTSPYRPDWIDESRHHFFGSDGRGTAPAPMQVENTILSVTAYRNFSEMWLRSGDLFDDQTNDQLAQADSNLSTLFSGQDFGEDILGAIEPEVQLLVARQSFENVLPRPSIKVPTFALVAQLRDVENMQPQLRRIFQSLIGFFNVAGAMNGQPQLDLDSEKFAVGDAPAQLYTSTFAPEPDERESPDARINFNFSPSIGFVGNRVVVSSTAELARNILKATGRDPVKQDASESKANSRIALYANPLHDVLHDNRDHLISQNMLEEGNSREEAETQIAALLDIIRLFSDASVTLGTEPDSLSLQLQLNQNTN